MKRLSKIVMSVAFASFALFASAQSPTAGPERKKAEAALDAPTPALPLLEPIPAAPKPERVPVAPRPSASANLPSNPDATGETAYPERSPGEGQMSIEARNYERAMLRDQERELAVQRAAVARADQRTRRLESRRWFGLSNARPSVSVDPYDGDYSPSWVGNDTFNPYRWVGVGDPYVVLRGNE